jgi:hypothetical protein
MQRDKIHSRRVIRDEGFTFCEVGVGADELFELDVENFEGFVS